MSTPLATLSLQLVFNAFILVGAFELVMITHTPILVFLLTTILAELSDRGLSPMMTLAPIDTFRP
jgi:hypothetical protein